MPYTKDSPNLPANWKKLPAEKLESVIKTFNGVYKQALKQGASKKEAESQAFKLANGLLKSGALSKKAKEAATRQVTRGMARTLSRGKVAVKCPNPDCGLSIPVYPGRYPKKCPTCKADLPVKGGKKVAAESARQAKLDELILTLSQRGVPEDVIARADALLTLEVSESETDESKAAAAKADAELEALLTICRESTPVKTLEDGVQYAREAFAYAPDLSRPDTWLLPLRGKDGALSPVRVKEAAASLSSGGLAGVRADIPREDLAGVKVKVRAAYRELDKDMPAHIRADEERVFCRESFAIDVTEGLRDKIANGILPIKFLEKGLTKDKKRFYTDGAIDSAIDVYEGAKMFADHPTKSDERERPERSFRDWIANLRNCRKNSEGHAIADAVIHEGWFKKKIAGLLEAGELEGLATSIAGIAKAVKGKIEGVTTFIVESIAEGRSCDFVTEPNAGGRAGIYESAGAGSSYDEDNDIGLLGESDLRTRRPDLVSLIEAAKEKELRKDMAELEDLQERVKTLEAAVTTAESERDEAKAELETKRVAEARAKVAGEIAVLIKEAKVPDKTAERLTAEFAEADKIDGVAEAIEREKTYLADIGVDESGKVKHLGRTTPGDEDGGAAHLLETKIRHYIAEGHTPEQAKELAEEFVKA